MAFDFSELDRFDAERPKPPPLLYKYVVPDRVDVLDGAAIRFTPPLNTNDIFEVRQSFDLIMGPKMEAYFKEIAADSDYEDPLREALDEEGLGFVSHGEAKAFFAHITGENVETALRKQMNEFLGVLPGFINTPESVENMLQKVAAEQLLLSLSERFDSSPMWAHYGDNSKGFVIAFDTTSDFFRRGDKGELQGLHKVKYFDGRVGELMDDPYAALVSKQADWNYEHEWRLYVKTEDAARVLEVSGDSIHLVKFPRTAVNRIILGVHTSEAVETRIRTVLGTSYPNIQLTRLKADRSTAKLIEQPA